MKQIHPKYSNPSYNSNISPLFGCQENQNENKKIFFKNIILQKKKKSRDSINKIRALFRLPTARLKFSYSDSKKNKLIKPE